MQPKAPSLAGRAFLAILLLIGFYVLAIAIVVALLGLLYWMFAVANRVDLRIVLFTLIGAGTVLWSIIPRWDKFVAPGPKLNPADHPALFDAVNEIAKETNQTPPAEIYADAQVNAWVANRGGIMGIGSKRIMGVGLPLLQGLSVSQFKAVLAHEYGHYHGGDTRLGPWIYQTRSIIGRTIYNLASQESVLHKPFLWYGNMFLRVTHAISRQQEYAADALAARTVGRQHLVEGLKRVHGSAVAYDSYWKQHVSPVLNSGYRAPLVQGFERYMMTEHVQDAMASATMHEIENGKQDPFDTHPPLPQRIDAVSSIEEDRSRADDRPAVALLGDVNALESAIFTNIANLNNITPFTPVAWHAVGEKVYLPAWQETLKAHGAALSGITPAELPNISASVGQYIPNGWQANTTSDARASQFKTIIGIGLAVLLEQQGWHLNSQVEDQVYFTCDGLTVFPFKVCDQLASGEMPAAYWEKVCLQANIESVDLGLLK